MVETWRARGFLVPCLPVFSIGGSQTIGGRLCSLERWLGSYEAQVAVNGSRVAAQHMQAGHEEDHEDSGVVSKQG